MSSLLPSPLRQSIAITGAGIVSPLGMGWQANEESLAADRIAFKPVEIFDTREFVTKTAGVVDLPTENLFHRIPAHKQAFFDRGTRMLLIAIREALAQAGRQNMEGIDAMVIGTSAGAMPLGESYFEHAYHGTSRDPTQLSRAENYQPQRQMSSIAAEFDWRGPVIIVSNACASGANAIGWAAEMIRSGRAKRVLAGGYDAIAKLVFAGFETLHALAPSGIPRPFDAQRDGLALGEGAAVMLLEAEDVRRTPALGNVAGYATATDLHHLTQPDPAGKAAIRTMTAACAQAGVSPAQIGYINSHGTGTPFNDAAEAAAIATWAGDVVASIPVSSTKSAMGHLLGGAGAVEAVICLMALQGQWLPASLNVREVDPAVRFDLVRHFRRSSLDYALTNSFGFGGTNATLVLQRRSA
ncbi:beta-ketoacyl-[acyl-carrier-protein] synthase family protein [Prosthecobacter sp.]|uniref:beta-ketoacyl-[acyl-carrier-protein] synthase family protein n=1 Tax=Prosthecobacter sp. TaxID=1965333 RepID=UPI0025F57F6C|nr:beta-ketoacyl-[acyl-carrier-protein] synthase family protein [Prosthecobacter sp.]